MSQEKGCGPACPHCGETEEWQLDGCYIAMDDLTDGDHVMCSACGEVFRFWQGQMVDDDTYHEYRSDSLAAAKYEEDAHGDDREHYLEGGWSGGYRNGREDFRSDC